MQKTHQMEWHNSFSQERKKLQKNPHPQYFNLSEYEAFFNFFVQCVQCNNGPSSMKSGALTNIAKHSFVMLQNR